MTDDQSAADRYREDKPERSGLHSYRIRFRQKGQEFSASAAEERFAHGDEVMIRTPHGIEPARIAGYSVVCTEKADRLSYQILRMANPEERKKYATLPLLEQEAFSFCRQQIDRLQLSMYLIQVERFFNGSKIIFYFTAESRVDFRELVKILVREFRTHVEMRQIGVRHETRMLGGLGPCGRELCCSAFLSTFDSVSIKMAKAQDLSLNPGKISGLCNRLLCCLTYEYDLYRNTKKGMPKPGKSFQFEGKTYCVTRQLPLQGKITALSSDGEERLFSEKEWRVADAAPKNATRKGTGRKYAGTPGSAAGGDSPPPDSADRE